MKKLINEKGAGGKEIVIGLLVLIGVFAFGVNSILNNTSDDDYKKMRIQADKFVDAVTIYKDEFTKDENIYYLYELEENNREEELIIVNPKNKKESCDMYESFVEIDNPKKVTLRCGSYLLEGDYQKKYDVYEIGEWQQKDKTGDTAFLYRYSKDGKPVLSDFVTELELIQVYDKNEEESFTTIDEVQSDAQSKGIEIDYDMFYRVKKLVKEIG